MRLKRRIYIVDDDEDDLYLIREAIKESAIELDIHFMCNGIKLLEPLDEEKQPPKHIVVDRHEYAFDEWY